MRRYAPFLIALALLSQTDTLAQTGFTTLPAREKTRLAQEEDLSSEKDPAFQNLMETGMIYFESNKLDEALSSFEAAGKLRPLNVYPPVMIEDVRLAMTMYVEPKKEEPKKEETKPSKPENESTADTRVAIMYEKEMAKVKKGTPPKPKEKNPDKEPLKNEVKRDAEGMVIFDSGHTKEAKSEDVKLKDERIKGEVKPNVDTIKPIVEPNKIEKVPMSEKEIQAELGATYPDGMTEKKFKEGNKEVIQRVVVKDKVGNEYRMVKQTWGGVFYFKNGTSVTQRVWDEEAH
jgi:hypothetical protein